MKISVDKDFLGLILDSIGEPGNEACPGLQLHSSMDDVTRLI